MANFSSGADRKPVMDYVDKYLNKTALTSMPVTNQKTVGQQYAGIRMQGVNDYFKNKAKGGEAGTVGLRDVIAVPSSIPGVANQPAMVEKQKPNTGNTYTVNAGNQTYVNQLNELYDKIVNRKPFQYDLNGDLLYQQMADQYMQMGKQASRNAMGQAASLTGGYGNSYAQQVGNQMNQQYMTALNQNIPELYQQALNAYITEGDRMMQQYELAAAHPGMVEAIRPKTYTVQQQSAEEGDDTSAYMQMLQNMISSGDSFAGTQPQNALNNWYYQLMNARK